MTFTDCLAIAHRGGELRFTHPDLAGYFLFAPDGKLSYHPTGLPTPLPGTQWPLWLADFYRADWREGVE